MSARTAIHLFAGLAALWLFLWPSQVAILALLMASGAVCFVEFTRPPHFDAVEMTKRIALSKYYEGLPLSPYERKLLKLPIVNGRDEEAGQ